MHLPHSDLMRNASIGPVSYFMFINDITAVGPCFIIATPCSESTLVMRLAVSDSVHLTMIDLPERFLLLVFVPR